jgi:pimeloyl-ACP methyl ester carboxylesterase
MPLASVSGRKLYYETHGDAPGTPLVLAMGLAGSCRGWHALQVPELAPHQRLILFDHRGVGESEDPGGPFTTADLADDLAGLLDELDVPRVHILGAFMGGMAAQEFALRHPGRLDHLALVGCYARPDAKRRMLLEKWRQMALEGTSTEIFMRERLLWTLQDETLEQTDLIEAMERSFQGHGGPPMSPDLLARQCEACLGHDTLDRLHEITAPTLVLCGRSDQLTPPKFHRQLADEIPGGRLVTFQYGAHLVIAESAERFNQSLLGFLSEPA